MASAAQLAARKKFATMAKNKGKGKTNLAEVVDKGSTKVKKGKKK